MPLDSEQIAVLRAHPALLAFWRSPPRAPLKRPVEAAQEQSRKLGLADEVAEYLTAVIAWRSAEAVTAFETPGHEILPGPRGKGYSESSGS